MSAPKWQAATIYLTGAIVQPVQDAAPVTNQAIANGDFSAGAAGWTLNNMTIVTGPDAFIGTSYAHMGYVGASGGVQLTTALPIQPGQTVTASCMIQPGGADDQVGGQIRIVWAGVAGDVAGNEIEVYLGSNYRKSTVTAVAPAGATGFKVQGEGYNLRPAGFVNIDSLQVSVTGGSGAPAGLAYKAVQVGAGTSAATEPAWPATLGLTVVDGGVTWEAITASYVTWTASPAMVSGGTEPTWPTVPGEFVTDGTISWECVTRRVDDERCPNSKVVAIIASKVFAVDKDIVRFSATANPKDWSSADDAGYLPTGLQQANAEYMQVLQPYRGNLCAWNSSSFQMWQVDPDPAQMALLDQMDGVGSPYTLAATAVGNDLYYLNQQGVRSVGIANAAENLQSGDVGIQIDPLVQAALIEAGSGAVPMSTYYPGAGQYWLLVVNELPPDDGGGEA